MCVCARAQIVYSNCGHQTRLSESVELELQPVGAGNRIEVLSKSSKRSSLLSQFPRDILTTS